MHKKGQAAMEFLMTYGWAILVVLAAIAALAYFGVLSPDRFLPEKCTMPSGIACLDFTGDADAVTVVLQNAAGFDMDNVNVSLAGDIAVDCTGTGSLANGEKDTFSCNPATDISTGKAQADLVMNYVNRQTNLTHTKTGEIILKIGE